MKCFGLKPLTLLFLSPPRSFPILVVVQKGSHRAYIVLIPQGINCVCLGEGGSISLSKRSSIRDTYLGLGLYRTYLLNACRRWDVSLQLILTIKKNYYSLSPKSRSLNV